MRSQLVAIRLDRKVIQACYAERTIVRACCVFSTARGCPCDIRVWRAGC